MTKPATQLQIIGGSAALDLVNTVDGSRDGPPGADSLRDYAELEAWAAHAGVLDRPAVRRLAEDADGAAALERVKQLRAAADDAFRAIAAGAPPPQAALDRLAAFGAQAVAHARLVPAGAGCDYAWDGDDPDRVLWPLAHAAVELLRHGPLDRLKVCADCRWLFLDTTRNHSRRWCTMSECGGRAKMRRYRARRATAGR
jgi:predicted RNA-binding Zn ribbon-like protein